MLSKCNKIQQNQGAQKAAPAQKIKSLWRRSLSSLHFQYRYSDPNPRGPVLSFFRGVPGRGGEYHKIDQGVFEAGFDRITFNFGTGDCGVTAFVCVIFHTQSFLMIDTLSINHFWRQILWRNFTEPEIDANEGRVQQNRSHE